MIGQARHRHLCDERLCGQTAVDQPRRGWHLHHHAWAGTAGKFRPPRHDHPILHGDAVQPLGDVGADLDHRRLAAWAVGVLRCQRHLDLRQVARERAAGTALGRTITLLRLGISLGDGLLDRFQAELQLLFRQPLGLGAELHPPQFLQKVVELVVVLLQSISLAQSHIAFGHGGQQQRAQSLDVAGQVLHVFRYAMAHTASARRQPLVCESLLRSAYVSSRARRIGLRTPLSRA